jgi:sulfonate transport system ATP-binding protein
VQFLSVEIRYDSVDVVYPSMGGGLCAIRNFSLVVEPGEFVGILGESGCGKSTLLRLASGLISPTHGSVFVNGKAARKADKNTGFVFQGNSLLPWLSVFENIAFGYKVRRESIPHNDIMSVIKLVGLDGFEHAKISSLSGGMAQRTSIARAIVTSPHLLLLDEPFAALDAITKKEIQDEVKAITNKLSITTVLVTHDFDEVIRLANRIVLLTPRPGIIFKIYDNNPQDEMAGIELRKAIMRDIYQARNGQQDHPKELNYEQ